MFCNYAFYFGATPKNSKELRELDGLEGCCGIKLFVGSSTGDLLVKNELDIEKIYTTPYLGAFCIAIGGYLLHTQPDDPLCISNECESLDDYKEYADKKQLQWRAGIIFISLGGILVAAGI